MIRGPLKKIMMVMFLFLALILISSCQRSEDTALAGLATKSEIGACTKDPLCKNLVTTCFTEKACKTTSNSCKSGCSKISDKKQKKACINACQNAYQSCSYSCYDQAVAGWKSQQQSSTTPPPKPSIPTCSENDTDASGNGNDPFQKGKTSSGSLVGYDYCAPNGIQLQEFYCENGQYKDTIIACENGCKDDACISGPSAPATTAQKECTTDAQCGVGKFCVYYGKCLDCFTSDAVNGPLYCDGKTIKRKITSEFPVCGEKEETITTNCAYGCKGGACLSEAEVQWKCSETDNGKDFIKQGTIIASNDQPLTDYCVNSKNPAETKKGDYLTEYYCDTESSLTKAQEKCNCVDGACV